MAVMRTRGGPERPDSERRTGGYARVEPLQEKTDQGRQRRLARLRLTPAEAEELSALHTRNFSRAKVEGRR
jgi:hypothetical protein